MSVTSGPVITHPTNVLAELPPWSTLQFSMIELQLTRTCLSISFSNQHVFVLFTDAVAPCVIYL